MTNSPAYRGNSFLMLTTSVYFLVGALLVVGQLVPGVTNQIAEGEMLPQTLLWLLSAALLASVNLLGRWLGGNFIRPDSTNANAALSKGLSFAHRQSWFPIVMIAMVCLLWIALSTRFVSGNGNLRYAINTAWQWGGIFAAFYVLMQLMSSWRVSRMLFAILFAMAWLSVVHGWYQVHVTLPADRASFKNNPEAILREHGIQASPGTAEYLRFESRLRDETPLGPFALTNSLAGFLVPWVVMAAGLGFRRDFWGSAPWRAGLGFFVLLSFLWCIASTESRSAWIAIAFGLITIVLCKIVSETPLRSRLAKAAKRMFEGQHALPWVFLSLIVIAILAFSFRNFDGRIFYSNAWKSLSFRADYWHATSQIIASYPLFGIGPGNFQAHYSANKPILAPEIIADPHNFFLETAATVGLPTGILLLIAIGCLIWKTYGFLTSSAFKNAYNSSPATTLDANTRRHIKSTSAIYFGAIAGAFALWFGSGALGSPPDAFPYAIGFPVVMVVLVVDYFVSLNTNLKPMEPKGLVVAMMAALIAMFVHLSVSSGWLTPGLMNSILVLVAGMITVMQRAESGTKTPFTGTDSVWVPVTAIGAWFFLGFFYWMAWLPLQSCKQIEAVAFREGLTEARAFEMIQSDHYNPRGYAFMVEVYVAQAEQELARTGSVSDLTWTRFDSALKKFLAVDSAEKGAWFQAGQWELRLSGNRTPGLKRTLSYFREASRRDPGDVGLLTQVALLAWLCEETATTQDFLMQVESIDVATPHNDKKLEAATVFWPPSIGPSSTRVKPQVWQQARQTEGLPFGWVRAREVSAFLRSQIGNAVSNVR
jgi:O-antigen ligase